jgi:hypothetical protein
MDELKYAKSLYGLQTRINTAKENHVLTIEMDIVPLQGFIEQIDGLMGEVAAQKDEITELKRSRDSFSGMWKRAALERLTAPMSKEEHERFHHDYVAFQIFDVNGFVAARAAAPATGAEQVHAPKTIVPEPDQRRIETERFPQKGQDNG